MKGIEIENENVRARSTLGPVTIHALLFLPSFPNEARENMTRVQNQSAIM